MKSEVRCANKLANWYGTDMNPSIINGNSLEEVSTVCCICGAVECVIMVVCVIL